MQNRKVGIYLRLSKEDEKIGESSSITNQRAILLDYIKKNNLEYVDEYIDDGVSGTTFNRIGFKKMLYDIEKKKINMVITKDTSRLGRDHIEFGYYVEKYFPEHNIRYVAVCDDIDTENNYNDMLLFKSAYNDMYVKDISNKIRASLNIKKRNGEFVGAYAPYGYKKSKLDKHTLEIDEETSPVVRKIYELFLNGNSITSIKNILTNKKIKTPSSYKNMKISSISNLYGIWNTRTITDILTNPTYIGNLAQGRCKKINYKSKKRIHVPKENWIIKNGACPKIIDEKTFNIAQALYQKNKYHSMNKQTNEMLLRGLIYCEECGHKIGFRRVTRKNKNNEVINRYYGNCNYYLKNKKYKVCTPHSTSYQELEKIIIKNISKILLKIDKDKVINKIKKENTNEESMIIQREITNLEKKLELLKIKEENLYEDKISNIIEKELYLKIKTKIEEEKKEIKIELEKEKAKKVKEIDWKEFVDQKLNDIDSYLINCLINKITLNEEGEIKVYYKIKN